MFEILKEVEEQVSLPELYSVYQLVEKEQPLLSLSEFRLLVNHSLQAFLRHKL